MAERQNKTVLIVLAAVTVGGWALWGLLHSRSTDTQATDKQSAETRPAHTQPASSQSSPGASSAGNTPAAYVGTERCASCHREVLRAYEGSHHDRALESPSSDTVLAPFAGETFRHDATSSTFFEEDGKYFVRTRGPSGDSVDYPVAYTFGVYPLQQYLLALDHGQLQAFTVAWDSRLREHGGQRYYDLYPDETLTPAHPLHFTQAAQNWNYGCADCHSTAFSKGYDPQTRSYSTQWVEPDVGCEACHGPGSRHVEWAKTPDSQSSGLTVALRRNLDWKIAQGARSATPQSAPDAAPELETCAPCHSRRFQMREGYRPGQPFLDAYRPELLSSSLYHDDGQIDEEVYVYGSFLQSRMAHAGVRCSDCHDPHSLSLRRPGNALCTECHSAPIFDSASHHHHQEEGSACVDCHMPSKTYMGVDVRRDHSIRIPRPALSREIGAPDPCTTCHRQQPAGWAAARIEQWFGHPESQHFGRVFHAVRSGKTGALQDLKKLALEAEKPDIVRGAALELLAERGGGGAAETLLAGSRDESGLVRLGAALGSVHLPPDRRPKVLRALLKDPLLTVRAEAARSLSELSLAQLSAGDRSLLAQGVSELLQLERLNTDRADGWLRIALLELRRGRPREAEAALERGLTLDRRFVPALVNLADLKRGQGDEEEGTRLLEEALGYEPDNPETLHAMGLSLIRRKQLDRAVSHLKKAAELRPENPHFTYVLAVALAEQGHLLDAVRTLQSGLDRHPRDPALQQALLGYAQQLGDVELLKSTVSRINR